MTVQEIIRVRAINRLEKNVLDEIKQIIKQTQNKTKELSGYLFLQHVNIETDIAIVLFWQGKGFFQLESKVAGYLKNILEQFGQVTHSIWKEME